MTMKTTAEGNGGGALLRRMILVLAVAAVMAAMLVSSVAPAFAQGLGRDGGKDINPCRGLHEGVFGDSPREASVECTPANGNASPS
jgi:hypothetical protein